MEENKSASPAALTDEQIIEAIAQMWSWYDWHAGKWTVQRGEVVEFARALLAAQPAAPALKADEKEAAYQKGFNAGYLERGLDDAEKPAASNPLPLSRPGRWRDGDECEPARADRQGVALSVNDALREWADEVGKAGFTRPNAGERAAFRDGFARASSSRAEVEIPEGYALVPKKVTNAMIDAANDTPRGIGGSPPHWQWVWDALLAAAEAPNAGESK